MLLGFHHAALSTPDLERLKRFYCEVVGFEAVWDGGRDAGTEPIDRMMALKDVAAKAAMLRTGNCFLEIFDFRAPSPKPRAGLRPVHDHGITHLCISAIG